VKTHFFLFIIFFRVLPVKKNGSYLETVTGYPLPIYSIKPEKRAFLNTAEEKKFHAVIERFLPILAQIPGFNPAVYTRTRFSCSPKPEGRDRSPFRAYFPDLEMKSPAGAPWYRGVPFMPENCSSVTRTARR
jgi:hypothetical protein